MSSVSLNARQAAFRSLEAAYAGAYAKAQNVDAANRALVHRYIATSSRAVAGEIRTSFQDPELAQEAERFADAAASKDPVRKGSAFYQFLKPLIPGGAAIGLLTAAFAVAVSLVAQVGDAGDSAGAAAGKVVLTGGVAVVLMRVLAYAAKGAVEAGKSVMELIGEAFRSNEPARRIVREIAPAEQGLLGAAARQAQRDRWLVDLTGPLAAALIAVLVAVPVALGGIFLIHALNGYGSSTPTSFPVPESEYELTLPE